MGFKRRDFIISSGLMAMATLFPNISSGKSISLGNRNFHIVGPGSLLKLPLAPKAGHSVNLIIPAKSIENPAKVEFKSVPLLGDKEDLVLDTFGHIRLTYIDTVRGWTLLPS